MEREAVLFEALISNQTLDVGLRTLDSGTGGGRDRGVQMLRFHLCVLRGLLFEALMPNWPSPPPSPGLPGEGGTVERGAVLFEALSSNQTLDVGLWTQAASRGAGPQRDGRFSKRTRFSEAMIAAWFGAG